MLTIIDALNDLIEQAIDHGGDLGGPYFCNEKGLADAADKMADVLGATWEWKEGYITKEYPVFKGPKKPDPNRPGPLPSNTHVILPDKCPKCGWYIVRDNDAYPPKYRLYCPLMEVPDDFSNKTT